MQAVETRVRARYAETDQMGVVYYANYLVWMEVGRVAYCSEVGFEYRDMEREDGALLAVTEVRCRYRAPARFHDEVRNCTTVTEVRSRTIRFSYQMRRVGDEQLLATGETLHTVCDRAGRTIRLPEKYRKFFPLTPRAEGQVV
jgi:acyl-CoA thioester hydrolase